ncbi:hypothetical protein ACN28E_02735 [Archangium lansingense]|uniref:hypothetical protein n=1 Tax=Archangium lansingense TaxID=2995310 RepID=UPI003B7ED5C6
MLFMRLFWPALRVFLQESPGLAQPGNGGGHGVHLPGHRMLRLSRLEVDLDPRNLLGLEVRVAATDRASVIGAEAAWMEVDMRKAGTARAARRNR